MAEESESKKFLDRLKEASVNVAQATREGIETLQTKRELSQTYGELGRKTAELVESGAITHPDLAPLVERIAELNAQLEAPTRPTRRQRCPRPTRAEPASERPAGRPSRQRPGLSGVLVLWAMWLVVCAATWATNARIPVSLLYGFHGKGVVPAAGRVVVLLGWPVALAAIPLMAVVVERFLASAHSPVAGQIVAAASLVSIGLCLTIAWPGAEQSGHQDAKYVNAPAAVGVAIAFGVTIYVVATTGRGDPPPRTTIDAAWATVFLAILLLSIPWLLANLGFYAGEVPGLRRFFMSEQVVPEPGHPHLRAVHLGNHEGIDGVLLAITAVVLMRTLGQTAATARRSALAAYLSLLFVYGLAVALADGWNEQIVKRGWAARTIPSVLHPSASWAWLAVLALALLVWLVTRTRLLALEGGARPRRV